MKVGVIGNGFVGEAQAFAFSLSNDVMIYDVDPARTFNTLRSTHSRLCIRMRTNTNAQRWYSRFIYYIRGFYSFKRRTCIHN